MPLTTGEILSDIPDGLTIAGLGQQVGAQLAALPPEGRTFEVWCLSLGFGPGLVMTVVQTVGKVKTGGVTAAEVMAILGVSEGGFLGKVVALAEKVIAQAKD